MPSRDLVSLCECHKCHVQAAIIRSLNRASLILAANLIELDHFLIVLDYVLNILEI